MINSIYKLLALLLIAVAAMLNLLWLAALFAVMFTFYFGAGWLLVLAVLLDGYFNAFTALPVFSMVTLVWYLMSEIVRSRISI